MPDREQPGTLETLAGLGGGGTTPEPIAIASLSIVRAKRLGPSRIPLRAATGRLALRRGDPRVCTPVGEGMRLPTDGAPSANLLEIWLVSWRSLIR
jgi:hypothetical protein